MDEEAKQFRDGLLNEIDAERTAGGDYSRTCFIDRACEILEAGEEFTEYHICLGRKDLRPGWPVQVDAYSFSPSDGVLNLIICEFSGAAEPEPLLTDEVKKLVQSGYRFLEGSIHGRVSELWDESHDAHALAREVFSFASEEMTKAYIYLVSDRPLSAQLGKIPQPSIGTQEVELQLWDIGRLARMEASAKGREEIKIDFLGQHGRGIPALSAGLDAASRYRSYMCVMPGTVLADLYDRFGGRILEQNVRAFLGEGRKVNKGIRETLRNAPAMFFAFNNGLTTTVSDLEMELDEDGQSVITSATGFQVVNGGQTTASLYWARKAGIDLSKVFVQMKLSQLPDDALFDDSVRDIARYANAQNAVSASDLFAGHPYFKRLEALSRQTVAPPVKVGEISGYWYFERTLGSYKVEIKRKNGLAAKTWQMLHPKRQVLTKTDVARYEVTFGGQPHVVSSGGQKNIAAFGKIISPAWDADPEVFDAEYFKHLVCRAILTRSVDGLIPKQAWYPGSIVRPLSSYTLAIMSERMKQSGLQLDYETIWKSQSPSAVFVEEAMLIASEVLPLLQEIPEEQVRNRLVTEWVKKEACWIRVVNSDVALSAQFLGSLASGPEGRKPKGKGWPVKAQSLWKDGSWKRLREWNKASDVLTPAETDLVDRAAIAATFGFKGFRLTKLEEAWDRAVENGFV